MWSLTFFVISSANSDGVSPRKLTLSSGNNECSRLVLHCSSQTKELFETSVIDWITGRTLTSHSQSNNRIDNDARHSYCMHQPTKTIIWCKYWMASLKMIQTFWKRMTKFKCVDNLMHLRRTITRKSGSLIPAYYSLTPVCESPRPHVLLGEAFVFSVTCHSSRRMPRSIFIKPPYLIASQTRSMNVAPPHSSYLVP